MAGDGHKMTAAEQACLSLILLYLPSRARSSRSRLMLTCACRHHQLAKLSTVTADVLRASLAAAATAVAAHACDTFMMGHAGWP